jgi:hypothetical protein
MSREQFFEPRQCLVGFSQPEVVEYKLLGEDAAWYINARSHGEEAYRRQIWKLWQLAE